MTCCVTSGAGRYRDETAPTEGTQLFKSFSSASPILSIHARRSSSPALIAVVAVIPLHRRVRLRLPAGHQSAVDRPSCIPTLSIRSWASISRSTSTRASTFRVAPTGARDHQRAFRINRLAARDIAVAIIERRVNSSGYANLWSGRRQKRIIVERPAEPGAGETDPGRPPTSRSGNGCRERPCGDAPAPQPRTPRVSRLQA